MADAPEVARSVVLYGWMRGSPLKTGQTLHLPGVGDFVPADVSVLDDPCPLPTQVKHRSLNERERLVYGPMSDIGSVFVDKDAVYVSINSTRAQPGAEVTVGEQMVAQLQSAAEGLDAGLEKKGPWKKMCDCSCSLALRRAQVVCIVLAGLVATPGARCI